MKPAESPSALKVQATLGEKFEVLEFDASTRTAADAAAAIGCEVAQIAKSLIFRGGTSGQAVLIIASGADRVDEKKAAAAIGEPIARADADFVREATGFAIGGVPPVGHKTKPIVLIEESLMQLNEIWAAAGTPNAVFRLTPSDLVELTGDAQSRSRGNRVLELAAKGTSAGKIRIGVGGWTYEPWRGGAFFPKGLTQARELQYAGSKLTSIEINGTYYGSQKPASFMKWHDETPDDFIFSVKGPRFATNRRILAEAGESIERFFKTGVTELKAKLGPINWQFATTKRFDAEDFAAFLKLLPRSVDGLAIRHVVEVRHESFKHPDFIALAREHGVAIAMAGDADYPQIADVTAPFVYARIMGTTETEEHGYSATALDQWANRAKTWAAGGSPKDLATVEPAPKSDAAGREVFLYVISGHKERNPAAAMALIERVG